MFMFCRPASSKKRFSPHRTINEEFTFTLFEKADHIPAGEWSTVLRSQNPFLELPYLSLVEGCTYSKLLCRYVIVYRNHVPCGLIYFQIIDFQAGIFGDLFSRQVDSGKSRRMSIFEKYIDTNREEVLLRLFTCGNNLVSGEHGFVFTENIGRENRNELLFEIIDLIAKEEKLRAAISAVLIKDFYHPEFDERLVEEKKYSSFHVEPNMIVDLPGPGSLNEYIELFSKKYRNRAKGVLKKLDGIEQRELTLNELIELQPQMFRLYENIFAKAKFKLIKLPPNYFIETKRIYPGIFFVKGFFREGQLLAFASAFVLPDKILEAHYIGFDYELNSSYDLYQNILYCMIAEGIRHGCTKVNLGRTAAEIKTTVGARSHDLICYIKPQNTISKIIQKPFIQFLQPAPWTPRNPFKASETAEISPGRT